MKNTNKGFLALLAACALAAASAPSFAAVPTPSSADKTYEQLKVLVDVLNFVQENYVDEPDTQKLIYGAAAGMMRPLDPFSQFLDPEARRELNNETEGGFTGLGIRLGMKDDWLTVITPLPGTPAYRLGILPNDRVVEIDGGTTKDMTPSDALKALRGPTGTKAKLTIMRAPEDGGDGPWTSHEFTLTREFVKVDSVQSWPLADGIGYLRIVEFSKDTASDVLGALNALKKDAVNGLILDLRNNPGGLLSSAVETASFFLNGSKLIVYTQGRAAGNRQEFRSAAQAPYAGMPLVVLVNGGSASGAEIVAGALQDHKRGPIVGARTYGKASVQQVIPLPADCGLRLTIARYYTPSGRSIQRDEKTKTGGITPDILVSVPRDVEVKLYNQWELIYAKDKKPRTAVKKEDAVRDEALERAMELLKARDSLGALKGRDG